MEIGIGEETRIGGDVECGQAYGRSTEYRGTVLDVTGYGITMEGKGPGEPELGNLSGGRRAL